MIQRGYIQSFFRALQKVSEEELAAEGNTDFDKLNARKFNNLCVIQASVEKACNRTRTHCYTPPELLGVLFSHACFIINLFLYQSRKCTKEQRANR